ncbi:hypothetical protein [Microbispora sp. NPDC049633]|uniref:hypothetical protein n=1 Tax=Microbispora sp. NPDC049633 TaxID=3154355 RepID=UPI00342F5A19
MKKADIRRGVPYAYGTRNDICPTYILSTDVLATPNGFRKEGEPLMKRSVAGKPSAGYRRNADTGYPMVQVRDDTPENRALAASITLEQFFELSERPKGLDLHVVTHLPKVFGPYDEWAAEQDRKRETEAREREERSQRREAELARIKALEVRAKALGTSYLSPETSSYGYGGPYDSVSIGVEGLEKLVALAEVAAKLPGLRDAMVSDDPHTFPDVVLDLIAEANDALKIKKES